MHHGSSVGTIVINCFLEALFVVIFPYPPDLLCVGIARTTRVDMPVLGSTSAPAPCEDVEGVSPSDSLPKGVRLKNSAVSPDGIDTQLSKAKKLHANKEKRDYKIMALRSSLKTAESLIDQLNFDITPGTRGNFS